MKTCGYCGTSIDDSYCSFCEMELAAPYITQNGERLANGIDYYPDESKVWENTSELLQLETIELLFLLRYAREHRTNIYKMRIMVHKAKAQNENLSSREEMESVSYQEYENATRKVWVIENIIKERIGYFPKKVTEEFLSIFLKRIEESEIKPMLFREKISKK